MLTGHEHHEGDGPVHVLKTPIWVLVVRGFQIFISLVIVGLAGRLMHDAYLDEEGLALAVSLFTWVIVAYVVLTEKLSGLHKLYHIIAVLVLEGFMVTMWLATFAAVAAERARYVVDVLTYGCVDDGSLFDSKTCLTKRGVILFETGAAMLAAIAGLGALMWLLFIATFVWTMVMFFRGRREGRFLFGTGATNEHQMETQSPMVPGQPEKFAQHQHQAPVAAQGPYAQQPAGYYQPQPGMQPQQEHYNQQAYQPSLSSQAVSPPPQQPQGPYQPPSHELHGQQQPYEQYQQYPPPPGQQQPGYPQQPPPQSHTPSNELEAGQQRQHYEMPSPPPASPPPAQHH